MPEELSTLEKRLQKLEDTIDKLAVISNDISKLLAVHEQRMLHYEKDAALVTAATEKRREELDSRLRDVYHNISKQELIISNEISKTREEIKEQYNLLNQRIITIEKFNWMTIGAAILFSTILSYIVKYLKIF